MGRHAVLALLEQAPGRIRELWCWSRDSELVQRVQIAAKTARIRVRAEQPADAPWADHVAQGLAADVAPFAYTDLDTIVPEEGVAQDTLLLVLDSITDSRNLGAILRSAAFFGVSAVILPQDRAAGVTPLVERIARGATATLPVVQVVNLARTLRALTDRGVEVVGTVVDPEADDLWQLPVDRPLAIALGAEDRGLRPLLRRHCERQITLPGSPSMDSLNVASFATLVLAVARRPVGAAGLAQSGARSGPSGGPFVG